MKTIGYNGVLTIFSYQPILIHIKGPIPHLWLPRTFGQLHEVQQRRTTQGFVGRGQHGGGLQQLVVESSTDFPMEKW